jgi:hypothetical protein
MRRFSWYGFGFLYLFEIHVFSAQVSSDFTELFEVFDDLLGEDIRENTTIFFEAFISEPEDVEAGFAAIMR